MVELNPYAVGTVPAGNTTALAICLSTHAYPGRICHLREHAGGVIGVFPVTTGWINRTNKP